jgi:hypothetical protein
MEAAYADAMRASSANVVRRMVLPLGSVDGESVLKNGECP